jgi:uncharacterized protein YceH (UPF0502 family)
MDIVLDDAEVRTLGCLIEKEMTTPEYYPLSLNALTNACNQKSNRCPVVSYDETSVGQKLESLQQKGLVMKTHMPGSRVPKYLHEVLDRFDLSRQEIALLCELMLRGPQTAGELRSHAERMSAFESVEEVEGTVQGLIEHYPPLAIKLAKEAGRKESRFMHLFSGADIPSELTATEATGNERMTRIEEEIAKLRDELEELRQAFAEFKSQF